MLNVKVYCFLFGLLFSSLLFGGNADSARAFSKPGLPALGAGFGMMTYSGNVGNTSAQHVGAFTSVRPAAHVNIEERLGRYFSLSLYGAFGHVAGNDHREGDNLNFETKVSQYGLDLIFPFDNGLILAQGSMVTPYLSLGIGFMSYRPFSDSLDSHGRPYYYWSDGSIRNVAEGSAGAPTAIMLHRDYVYETPLSGPKSTLVIPLGLGVRINLTDHLNARVNFAYNYTLSKDMDGKTGAGSADKYMYTNVSLSYQFGKSHQEEENNKIYEQVDWVALDNLDSDGDGVKDVADLCPGTPKGVKVDEKGCPLDTDGDGVPDYLDKEPNTKKGSKVDEHGVKLDFKKIAADQSVLKRYDSIYAVRSKTFNAAPSLETLKAFEKEMASISPKNAAIGKNRMPENFKALDKDHNGMISVAELNSAIDAFFSGENSLTVDQINKLIDFFFEQ